MSFVSRLAQVAGGVARRREVRPVDAKAYDGVDIMIGGLNHSLSKANPEKSLEYLLTSTHALSFPDLPGRVTSIA